MFVDNTVLTSCIQYVADKMRDTNSLQGFRVNNIWYTKLFFGGIKFVLWNTPHLNGGGRFACQSGNFLGH